MSYLCVRSVLFLPLIIHTHILIVCVIDKMCKCNEYTLYVNYRMCMTFMFSEELILTGSCRRVKNQAILLDIFSNFSNTIKR